MQSTELSVIGPLFPSRGSPSYFESCLWIRFHSDFPPLPPSVEPINGIRLFFFLSAHTSLRSHGIHEYVSPPPNPSRPASWVPLSRLMPDEDRLYSVPFLGSLAAKDGLPAAILSLHPSLLRLAIPDAGFSIRTRLRITRRSYRKHPCPVSTSPLLSLRPAVGSIKTILGLRRREPTAPFDPFSSAS